MTKVELLDKSEEARKKLLQAIEGLTEEEMTQGLVNPEWDIKDILGHITSWEEEDRKVAEEILKEGNPQFDYVISPEDNWREWNVKQVEKKRGYSLKRILSELEREHGKFMEMVRGLTEEQLTRKAVCPWQWESTVEGLIQTTFEHDEEHTEKILEWRKGKESSSRQ